MGALSGWMREAVLAAGLILLLIIGLWVSTGSMPPMVVVESQSMMHDPQGEVGAIDPGDLVLVMAHERHGEIVSWAEAVEEGGGFEGWSSHGDPGDVIIYSKNGGSDTPVIHRVLLHAVAHDTVTPLDRSVGTCPDGASWDPVSLDGDGQAGTCVLTWDLLGTNVTDVATIDWTFTDIQCSGQPHGLMIQAWDPGHAGYLTLGDNNDCNVDQGQAAYSLAQGLSDENGRPVLTVRDDWVQGVAGAEIPWAGTVKLLVANNAAQVTSRSWTMLAGSASGLLLLTWVIERGTTRLISEAPEIELARKEAESSVEEE
uniref:Signal peptidase I n=1 Tax=uncultured marine group II/III euryarchaeote KM3_05_H10 TaxID=1457839 RepID=A0A075G4I8_9EURY|nr:Signal peptidase I [uncultured marine group II/III euryarchaeote KM3_05_H10]